MRWPDEIPGTGPERGIPLGVLRELAEYWRSGFDWRAAEASLNRFPQYMTQIDGQRIHFLHVRSERADAMPLLITHGYPSSVAEFSSLIDLLVAPEDGPAFHVIAPSLPGYAYWGQPSAVPQGFAVFGADETVRRLIPASAEAHWTEFARGRHFPAMEAPADLATDLRAFFAALT